MPPQRDDTATKRAQHQAREDAARDWQGDIAQITGEPFHRRTFMLRVHPHDVVRFVKARLRAERSGSLEIQFRLRDQSGEYVSVRARVYRVDGEWIGAVRRIVRPDCEWWPEELLRAHRN